MRRNKQLTNIEVWNIISKEYISAKEISAITLLSLNNAYKIKREIEAKLTNWLLPKSLIPTKFVLEKLGMNSEEIYIKAKMEKELE